MPSGALLSGRGRPATRKPTRHDKLEAAIQAAGSIGGLERLAGVGTSDEERAAFWLAFRHLPGAAALDAGVAELKRRIGVLGRATAPSIIPREIADA